MPKHICLLIFTLLICCLAVLNLEILMPVCWQMSHILHIHHYEFFNLSVKKKRNACLKSQRLQRREAVKMGKPTIDKYQANGYCCLSLSITVTPHKLS